MRFMSWQATVEESNSLSASNASEKSASTVSRESDYQLQSEAPKRSHCSSEAISLSRQCRFRSTSQQDTGWSIRHQERKIETSPADYTLRLRQLRGLHL